MTNRKLKIILWIQSFTVYHCLFCPLNLSAEIFFPLTTDVTNVSLKQRRCKMKSSHVTCPLPLFTYLKFLNSPAASPNSGSSQPYYLEVRASHPFLNLAHWSMGGPSLTLQNSSPHQRLGFLPAYASTWHSTLTTRSSHCPSGWKLLGEDAVHTHHWTCTGWRVGEP